MTIGLKKKTIYLSVQIASRCLPYITIIFLWGLIFNVWQVVGRGWPILGNSWLLILAMFMLCLLAVYRHYVHFNNMKYYLQL